MRRAILGLCAIGLIAAGARAADPSPIEVRIRAEKTKAREKGMDMGMSGRTTTEKTVFVATVSNRQISKPVQKIRLKLYSVSVSNDFDPTWREYHVEEVLESEVFDLGPNEKGREVTVGHSAVESFDGRDGDGEGKTGASYKGCLVEVYIGEPLVDVIIRGGTKVRDAVTAYRKEMGE